MIFDGTLKFSNKQRINTSGATVSENTWDRGVGSGRLFGGRIRIAAFCVNDPNLTSATTVDVKIQSSDDNSTWHEEYSSSVAGDKLKAGSVIIEGFPVTEMADGRYIRLSYEIGGTPATTAPAITAFVAMDGTPFVDHEFSIK